MWAGYGKQNYDFLLANDERKACVWTQKSTFNVHWTTLTPSPIFFKES